MSAEKVYTDRLYAGLDWLLPHKSQIEKHLKDRLGSLFDLEYDLLLYDVTSTYFEGQCSGNGLAKRGYSRDGRSGLPASLHRPGGRRPTAFRWATRFSPATAMIRPRWKRSSRRWSTNTAKPIAFG